MYVRGGGQNLFVRILDPLLELGTPFRDAELAFPAVLGSYFALIYYRSSSSKWVLGTPWSDKDVLPGP